MKNIPIKVISAQIEQGLVTLEVPAGTTVESLLTQAGVNVSTVTVRLKAPDGAAQTLPAEALKTTQVTQPGTRVDASPKGTQGA